MITEAVTPVVDPIQSTRCILRLYCTSREQLDKMLLSDTNTVRLLIRRDGVPVWGGYLDTEGVEVPEPYERGYRAELSFGDFAPLKLIRYVPQGLITIKEALGQTVGALGVPVKTDGAHPVAHPSKQYVDTSLLGGESSRYELLELVAQTLGATVRQWEYVRFDNPLRHKQLPRQAIRYTYDDNSYTALGRLYNTINYSLTAPKPKRESGEVFDVTEEEKIVQGGKACIVGSIPRGAHTFAELAEGRKGFLYLSDQPNSTGTQGVLVQDGRKYKEWLERKAFGFVRKPSKGDKVLELVSECVWAGDGKKVNISAFAHIVHPFFGDNLSKMPEQEFLQLHIPAVVTLEEVDGKCRYLCEVKTGDQERRYEWRREPTSVTLIYCNGGFGEQARNCMSYTDPIPVYEDSRKKKGKSKDNLILPEGIEVTLPVDAGNVRLRVAVYDGVWFALNGKPLSRSMILFPGGGEGYGEPYMTPEEYLTTVDDTGLYLPLYWYWRTLNKVGDQPEELKRVGTGGVLMERLLVTVGDKVSDDSELTVQAFVRPEVTEEIDYHTRVSTWDGVPAWAYIRTDPTEKKETYPTLWGKIFGYGEGRRAPQPYLPVQEIGGRQHWELVVEGILTLYGARGQYAHLDILGEPKGQVYTFGGKAYWLTGARVTLREGRTELDLQEIQDITWYGQAQL